MAGGSDGHGNLGSPKDKRRVLKRSSTRDFVYGGDGQEQDGTGNTGVHEDYVYSTIPRAF